MTFPPNDGSFGSVAMEGIGLRGAPHGSAGKSLDWSNATDWFVRGRRLPLARSNDQCVWHAPPAWHRQGQGWQLHDELCRWPSVEVEGVSTAESALLGRVGKKSREGCGSDPGRNDEHDGFPLGADCGSLRDLWLQLLNLSTDNETGNALNNEARCTVLGDVRALDDPSRPVVDHEGAPFLPLAAGYDSSLVD